LLHCGHGDHWLSGGVRCMSSARVHRLPVPLEDIPAGGRRPLLKLARGRIAAKGPLERQKPPRTERITRGLSARQSPQLRDRRKSTRRNSNSPESLVAGTALPLPVRQYISQHPLDPVPLNTLYIASPATRAERSRLVHLTRQRPHIRFSLLCSCCCAAVVHYCTL
jgi:hypothetical protein